MLNGDPVVIKQCHSSVSMFVKSAFRSHYCGNSNAVRKDNYLCNRLYFHRMVNSH